MTVETTAAEPRRPRDIPRDISPPSGPRPSPRPVDPPIPARLAKLEPAIDAIQPGGNVSEVPSPELDRPALEALVTVLGDRVANELVSGASGDLASPPPSR